MTASASITRYWNWLLVAVVLVAIAAVVVGTRHGVGATPDSATYASVAENLSQGRGLTVYDGSELTLFPPGLSAILALGAPFGLSPQETARVLNLLSVAAIVLLSAVLLRRTVASPPLRLAGVALVAVAPALLWVSVMLWSEIPFIAVTLGFLIVLWRALEDRSSYWLVIGAAVLAGAGFLLRYPGLVLIGFGAAALAVPSVRERSGRDLGRLGVFLVVGLIPVSLWLLHNASHGTLLSAASGSPLEDRTRTGLGLGTNLGQALETIGSWLAPSGSLLALGVVVAVAIALAWQRRRVEEEVVAEPGVWLLGLFSLAYIAFVVLGASVTYVDALDDRLLSPVFVPLLVVFLAGFERLVAVVGDGRRVLAWALIGALAVWALYPVSTWLERVDRGSEGVGFATTTWHESETIAALLALPAVDPLYSNWPDGTYYAGGLQPIGFGPIQAPTSIARFTEAVRCAGGARFAQFVYDRPQLLYPDELGPGVEVEVIRQTEDGVVYRVSPAPGAGDGDCAT